MPTDKPTVGQLRVEISKTGKQSGTGTRKKSLHKFFKAPHNKKLQQDERKTKQKECNNNNVIKRVDNCVFRDLCHVNVCIYFFLCRATNEMLLTIAFQLNLVNNLERIY